MTTVSEQMSWAASGGELKAYLGLNGISSDEETRLQLWLEAAIRRCDEYLERDFVISRARWVVGATVDAGYQYTIIVQPEDDSDYTPFSASYTASTGDSPQKVAWELRKALDIALASRDVTVGGSGAAVDVVMDDVNAAMEVSNAVAGGASITQTVFWSTIPVDVRFGVFEYVKALRAVLKRAPGLTSVKTAALSETYAQGGAAEHAFQAAKPYWAPYKKHPLLDGN